VHVPSGEPPQSKSRPPAKRKPGVVRPITQGKLLKRGGPSDKPATSRPKPAARPLPGGSATPAHAPVKAPAAASAAKPAPTSSAKAPPPPPPPPPPHAAVEEPQVDMYRATYAFEGQEGEISLSKGDVVEVVEKEDNGWWLVKKNGREGWTPSSYLELVPPKPKATSSHPAPARRPPPSAPGATKPAAATSSAPKAPLKPVTADVSAKPVSVFPGMAPANGSAAPWKKAATAGANGSADSTSASSRPSSSLAPKPPVASKPKPATPPVAAKPGAPKVPGKPPVPTAPRPPAAPSNKPAGAIRPAAAAGGQLDLAAALAKRAQRIADAE